MTRRVASCLALGLILGASAATAGDGEGIAPRWRFRAGDAARYELRQKGTIKGREPSAGPAVTTEVAIEFEWAVESVEEDGTATIRMTLGSVRASIENGPTTLRYDSASKGEPAPASAPLASIYKPALAGAYRLKVDARGRIVEAVVPPALTEALRTSPFREAADGGGVFTEAGLKNLLGQLIPVFPADPVAPGDSWERSIELPLGPVVVALKPRYRLDGAGPESATVDVALGFDARAAEGSGATIAIDEGGGTGRVVFDRAAGRLVSSTLTQTLDLTLGIDGKPLRPSTVIEASLSLRP